MTNRTFLSASLLCVVLGMTPLSLRGISFQDPAAAPSTLERAEPPSFANPDSGEEQAPAPQRDSGKKAGRHDETTKSLKQVFLHLPSDQKTIWTSPFHVKARDSVWLLPLAGSTALLMTTDHENMRRLHVNSSAISLSNNISNAGAVALVGLPATMYVWGKWEKRDRLKETGLLGGEALINSLIVSEGLKTMLGRERPTITDGQGHFFQDFRSPSFPSEHAMLSWSSASVIAHEYPGWLSQTLAYGTAAAVSVSRVTGRKHFPSDVVAGSALGWLVGRQIYMSRHDPEIENFEYGNFVQEHSRFQTLQTGSSYVPLDSWVYPAFDQLQALGYLPTALTGLRPWTRGECARLVRVASQSLADSQGISGKLFQALQKEFAPELQEQPPLPPNIWMEELYARAGHLSGDPLVDDYHFAKTFTNDYGRPFGTGANAVVGMSARSVVGPFAFYVRGEYPHAGTLATTPLAAQQAITTLEGLPFAPAQRTDSLDQFRFLDTYVSLNIHNNLITFGKQTLWWGPGADGPFLASDNAEPVLMLRLSRASPFILPWVLQFMGPIRLELFAGQLEGQQFVAVLDAAGNRQVVSSPLHPHPYIQGAKFSFKPTQNLEFGLDVTSVFSGPGFPLTFHSFLRSYSPSNGIPGTSSDPGDRRSAFDFSYRLPGLRNWLTLYSDSFTEDEFSPITFPRKSSFRAGLYMPRLPRLEQIDLRVEGVYTDIPNLGAAGAAYFNTHYLSGYTNYGQIIGNAIGREGRGINAWSTYRFSAMNTVQLHYRNQHVNREFLEGGYLQDFDLNGSLMTLGSLVFSGQVKYEHWAFPLLSPTPKSNTSVTIQVSFRPPHGSSLFSARH